MNRGTDWSAVRCPTCGGSYSYANRVPAPAGDGYPTGVRVATCSPECAAAWADAHARIPTTLFGGP